MRALHLLPLNEKTKELYADHSTFHDGDSGLDLFFHEDVIFAPKETTWVHLGIKGTAYNEESENVSWLILPRSSIAKTPLRLANSIGLIDAGYRGEIIGAFDNIRDEPFEVKAGQRLLQAVYFDGRPFNLKIVDKLSETSRAEGGYGSTNKADEGTDENRGVKRPLEKAETPPEKSHKSASEPITTTS